MDPNAPDDIGRLLRDLQAEIKAVRHDYRIASVERIEQLWASVRETMDVFTNQLAEAELGRRGHSDTLAMVIAQQRQFEVVLQSVVVNNSQMELQLNTMAVALEDHKKECALVVRD